MAMHLALSYSFDEEVMAQNTAGSLNPSKMQKHHHNYLNLHKNVPWKTSKLFGARVKSQSAKSARHYDRWYILTEHNRPHVASQIHT